MKQSIKTDARTIIIVAMITILLGMAAISGYQQFNCESIRHGRFVSGQCYKKLIPME